MHTDRCPHPIDLDKHAPPMIRCPYCDAPNPNSIKTKLTLSVRKDLIQLAKQRGLNLSYEMEKALFLVIYNREDLVVE